MERRPRHLALIGMMGAGKSSVGRCCAERLGWPFADTDELVELACGRSVAELFAIEGEAAFRVREAAVLADVLAAPEASVVSCGGGVVVGAGNRRLLRDRATVVWLQASPAELARRLGDAPVSERPLLAAGSQASTLARLANLRVDAYESAADAAVWTQGRSIEDVATEVLDVLALREGNAT